MHPILTIIGAFSCLSPAIDVRQNCRGSHVVETLERVTRVHGKHRTIRVDNGPEFICKALDLGVYLNDVTLDFSRPGKPTDNAFIESFNGSFRAECLDAPWFLSLEDTRSKCEAWRMDYNEVRPHSSIGQKTPIELAKGPGQACLACGPNTEIFSDPVAQCRGKPTLSTNDLYGGPIHKDLSDNQGRICASTKSELRIFGS